MAEYIDKWSVVNRLIDIENEFQRHKPFHGFEHAMYRKICETEIAIGKTPAAERRMIMSIEYPCVYWSDGMCKKFSDDKSTSWCVEGPCGGQMQSNADRIRAMSDEELMELLEYELGCPATGNCEKMNRDCKACWLDWLQQPIKEEQ